MQLVNIAAFFSTALAIYSIFPYIQAILTKKTKPHQFTWLVFFIMNGIVFFSQYFAGARASVLISLTFFIGSFFIFLLSIKFGIRDSSKLDKLLFIFALSTIGLWLLTKNNSVAIWLTILIDLSATTMMVLKVKSQPDSEDPFPWIIGAAAYVFTCLTLTGKPISILYVRPIYGLVVDALLVLFIYYCRNVKRKKLLYDSH